VIGGDFVVVVDPTGTVRTTSVALTHPVREVAREPKLTLDEARKIAAAEAAGREAGGELVVYALGDASSLAWRIDGPEHSTFVDALTGAILDRLESTPGDWYPPPTLPTCTAANGSGSGHYDGPVSIVVEFCHSTAAPSYYWMADPRFPGLGCGSHTTNTFFTGSDAHFGNGALSDQETQCVDAMFAAQTQLTMLGDWLGRSGLDNQGNAVPILVGAPFADIKTTTVIQAGHDPNYQRPLTTLDMIGLAMGRVVDHTTPSGVSRKGTQTFIADAFGIATEIYANESQPFDTPDWAIGEMTQDQFDDSYPPWLEALRRPEFPPWPNFQRCYYTGVENDYNAEEMSGIGDYWFFLLANGTNHYYDEGWLSFCNGSRSPLSGIGLINAFTILYHAMLMKTSDSSYPKYRLWTVTAAKNLFNYQCETVNRVKAAWDAANVPAQPDEPVCVPDPKTSTTHLPYPLTDVQPN